MIGELNLLRGASLILPISVIIEFSQPLLRVQQASGVPFSFSFTYGVIYIDDPYPIPVTVMTKKYSTTFIFSRIICSIILLLSMQQQSYYIDMYRKTFSTWGRANCGCEK